MKTGPKTTVGRKAVRQNARTHGIFSELAVIPQVEDEDDWRTHLLGIKASVEPQNYMELVLVERVASLLWRMQRVMRFELAALELGHQGISVLSGPIYLEMQIGSEAVKVERLLPETAILDRVMRYEAHLQRHFLQTLHELEVLQSRRRGEVAQVARLDVTVSPDGSN